MRYCFGCPFTFYIIRESFMDVLVVFKCSLVTATSTVATRFHELPANLIRLYHASTIKELNSLFIQLALDVMRP